MKESQKAAIEEAEKLPTAEQVLESKPNNSKYEHFYHGAFVLQIMEEYTAAHTAGLREEIDNLQEDLSGERILLEAARKQLSVYEERGWANTY